MIDHFAKERKSLQTNDNTMFVFTGSYTKRSECGLRVFSFHTESGKLRLLHEIAEKNATFLDVNENTAHLYCTAEMPDQAGEGAVAAYRIDPNDGDLTFVNRQPAAGARPTYVRVDGSGRYILAANTAVETSICIRWTMKGGSSR